MRNIDKYSYVATLEEVANNDYNLNIPRYVDTFEEEVVLDIETISQKLKSIDLEIKAIDNELIGFCKELNITTPF